MTSGVITTSEADPPGRMAGPGDLARSTRSTGGHRARATLVSAVGSKVRISRAVSGRQSRPAGSGRWDARERSRDADPGVHTHPGAFRPELPADRRAARGDAG